MGGTVCVCNGRPNLEESIKEFLDNLVISKTSINEYRRNLDLKIKDKTFNKKTLFSKQFLEPLLEVNSLLFKDVQPFVKSNFIDIFKENPIYFLMSLAFLSDTVNYNALKSNYEILLFETFPKNLTKTIRKKNSLRVFKKFFKFYVKLISQYIINATEPFFKRTNDERNAILDLKTIYGNLYINEYIKYLFAQETEKAFNLEKFLYVHYADLKHSTIREKIYEIYASNMNRDYTFEKGVNDLTDEFSEEEDIQSEITKAPKLVELGEEDNDDNIREFTPKYKNPKKSQKNTLQKSEKNITPKGTFSNKSIKKIKKIKQEEEKVQEEDKSKILIAELDQNKNYNSSEEEEINQNKNKNQSINKNKNQNKNIKKIENETSDLYEKKIEKETSDIYDIVESTPQVEKIRYTELEPRVGRKIGTLINKIARGFLSRKNFKKNQPQLKNHQSKVQEYIMSNFTSERIKKSENQRKYEFNVEGWKKFYPENEQIHNIDHGKTFETNFSIFNSNEFY